MRAEAGPGAGAGPTGRDASRAGVCPNDNSPRVRRSWNGSVSSQTQGQVLRPLRNRLGNRLRNRLRIPAATALSPLPTTARFDSLCFVFRPLRLSFPSFSGGVGGGGTPSVRAEAGGRSPAGRRAEGLRPAGGLRAPGRRPTRPAGGRPWRKRSAGARRPGPASSQSPRPCGQLLPPAPAALAGPGSEGGGGGSGDRDKMTNESKWDEEALPSAMGGGGVPGAGLPLGHLLRRAPAQRRPSPPPSTPHSRQAPSSTPFSLCSQAHLNYFSGEGGPPGGPALRPPVCTAPEAARDERTQVFAVHAGRALFRKALWSFLECAIFIRLRRL